MQRGQTYDENDDDDEDGNDVDNGNGNDDNDDGSDSWNKGGKDDSSNDSCNNDNDIDMKSRQYKLQNEKKYPKLTEATISTKFLLQLAMDIAATL